MFNTRIFKILMDSADDVAGLEKLIDDGVFGADEVRGIMVSHEGDNYGRALTTYTFADLLARRLGRTRDEIIHTVPIQGIAGMSGFIVPHAAVIVRQEVPDAEPVGKRLAVAAGCTRDMLPEEVGTMVHLQEVRRKVEELMAEAGIESPDDVHFIFVKGPRPGAVGQREAESRGQKLVVDDKLKLGELARSASALGAALALGEVEESAVGEDMFVTASDRVYSMVTHCSVGEERRGSAIILLGNSPTAVSETVIGHGVMSDGIDADGVKQTLRDMGFDFECCPSKADLARIDYAFVKPKSGESQTIRGYRHTMTTDDMIGIHSWYVEKAPVHAVVSSVLGTPLIEVASGGEHQGPFASSLLSIVARVA